MTDEADVERGRRIARHYPLHRVLRETLAHEIAYAVEDARRVGAATELRRLYDEHRGGSGDLPDLSLLLDRACDLACDNCGGNPATCDCDES